MPASMPTSSGVKVQANATALPTRNFSAAPRGRHDQRRQTAQRRAERSSHGILLDRRAPRLFGRIITENGNLCHALWARRVDPEQGQP
jgi:hypothetical protein